MIKIVVILLSIALGFVTSFFGINCNTWLHILFGVLLTLAFLVGFVALFFIISGLILLPINKKVKRTKITKFYRNAMLVYEKVLFSLFGMKRELNGIEKLDGINQYIVISNHQSNLDQLLMDSYLKDYYLMFLAKKSLFKIPFVGRLIHANCYACLDRVDIRKDIKELQWTEKMMLDNSYSLGIFPEGTRSHDGLVHEFKPASLKIAYKTKMPIVISAIRGTRDVNNGLLIKKHIVKYDVLEVIPYEKYITMSTVDLATYCENKIKSFVEGGN